MSESTHVRGSQGEQVAARFLIRKGYTILHRNYRDKISRSEIDLVVRQDDCIVFVEVKTGSAHTFGAPETWVDVRKQRRVARAASHYIHEHDLYGTDCRFDVIGITVDQGRYLIKHLEHAFMSTL